MLLRREGWQVNVKRVSRLYREQGQQLRNNSPKRRVKAKLRENRSPATGANQVWAMDFVHDQLFDGRKFRVLTMVDTFTRLSPAIDVRHCRQCLCKRSCGRRCERRVWLSVANRG